jgi:uncharacterized protein (DUF2062 family)
MPAPLPHRPERRRLYRRLADWLLRHQGTPQSIAMGFAVGMFVALTPTVGLQMILGGVIAHFLKGNRAIAAALAWITNPLTMGPIFYFNYRVGALFLPGDEEAGKRFIDAISPASLTNPSGWWDAILLMLRELWGVAGVLWAGSVIVGGVAAAISYPVVLRIVIAERKKLERVRTLPSLPPREPKAKSADALSPDPEPAQSAPEESSK